MSKQTAVEWIYENLKVCIPKSQFNDVLLQDLFNQAIAIEKELMIDAHIEGQRVFDNYQHTQWTTDQAEQYYNETYGGDK
jgi:hypothetical protein